MASRYGTLSEVVGDDAVAVRVTREGKTAVFKGRVPAAAQGKRVLITNRAALVIDADAAPTEIDEWFEDWRLEGAITIAVIFEWFAPLPLVLFCLLHPDVAPMKARLDQPVSLYTKLMNAGMAPNQLRAILGEQLDRSAFYTAFHDTVPKLSPDRLTGFLTGCLDLEVTTLMLKPGTAPAKAIARHLLSPRGPMDRGSRFMVAFDGCKLEPFSNELVEKSTHTKRMIPMFNITPRKERQQYFQATVKAKREVNQSPSNGTIFVAGGITRVPRGAGGPGTTASLLFIAMEVSATVAAKNAPEEGQNFKCRVMSVFTMQVPKREDGALSQFYAAAEGILCTLYNTNMASKGPVQSILSINGTPQQAIEATFAMYKNACGVSGIQLKWQAMKEGPAHFELGEKPTFKKILTPLARRCVRAGTQNMADLVLRTIHGSTSKALCKAETELGVESLLAMQIIRILISQVKEELQANEDPDDDLMAVPYTTTFLSSFATLLQSRYDPKMNDGWELGNIVDQKDVESIALACGIDVCESLEDPASPRYHPELLYFNEKRLLADGATSATKKLRKQ